MNATTLAFDRLAPRYDALAGGELFRIMRQRTHDVFAKWFPPGSRVLEIGCGTGLDTAFLASRNVDVVACDPSEAMVGRTLNRVANERASARVTVLPCGLQNLATYLEGFGEREPFDGIISNFGALNCVESLLPLNELAARQLRPGGPVLLGLMGRTCMLEVLYFALSGRRALIQRRCASGGVPVPVGGMDVPTYYHRTSDVAAALSPSLAIVGIAGIGVAIPPPYLEARWQACSPVVRTGLAALDKAVASWPPFNRLGDHVLLQFVKHRRRDD